MPRRLGRTVALLLLLGPSCGKAGVPAPEAGSALRGGVLPTRPSIVLVTIDTLRRGHLGCYGYPRPTSPHLDALAAESVLFENVLAPMASTFPSHLSMLTGLYPFQHGVTSNRMSVREPFHSTPGRASLIPELRRLGWNTAAFTSSVVLNPRTGVAEGFATGAAPGDKDGNWPADRTTELALGWLAKAPAEPFFLWVHYFDVHEPNDPPQPYRSLFQGDAALEDWLARQDLGAAERGERFEVAGPVARRFFGRDVPLEESAEGVRETDSEVRESIEHAELLGLYDRYDGSVRFVDEEIGRLLAALRERGLWDHTLVAVTADHGQSLGEADFFGHGRIVEVNTRVPLIVHFPPGLVEQPARFAPQMSLVDLVPTLLGRFEQPGLETFRAQLQGEDVLSGSFAREVSLTQQATEFRFKQNALLFALHSGRWKLIAGEDGPQALYDLEGRGEGADVRAAHPEIVQRLEGQLAKLLAQRRALPATEGAPDSPETERMLEQLESLGYAGD